MEGALEEVAATAAAGKASSAAAWCNTNCTAAFAYVGEPLGIATHVGSRAQTQVSSALQTLSP